MHLFLEQLLNGVATGSIYALVTLGLALVYGIMRILHVAHAAVYTIGAYIGVMLFNLTGSLIVALVGSMAVCAVVGVVIERFVYFPLLKYPPFVPLIGSIAVLLSVEELCRLVAGPQILTFPARLPFPEFQVGGVHRDRDPERDLLHHRRRAPGALVRHHAHPSSGWPCGPPPRTSRSPTPWGSTATSSSASPS